MILNKSGLKYDEDIKEWEENDNKINRFESGYKR